MIQHPTSAVCQCSLQSSGHSDIRLTRFSRVEISIFSPLPDGIPVNNRSYPGKGFYIDNMMLIIQINAHKRLVRIAAIADLKILFASPEPDRMVFPCNSARSWRGRASRPPASPCRRNHPVLRASSLLCAKTPRIPPHSDKVSLAMCIARPAAGRGPSRIASNSASRSSAADFARTQSTGPEHYGFSSAVSSLKR